MGANESVCARRPAIVVASQKRVNACPTASEEVHRSGFSVCNVMGVSCSSRNPFGRVDLKACAKKRAQSQMPPSYHHHHQSVKPVHYRCSSKTRQLSGMDQVKVIRWEYPVAVSILDFERTVRRRRYLDARQVCSGDLPRFLSAVMHGLLPPTPTQARATEMEVRTRAFGYLLRTYICISYWSVQPDMSRSDGIFLQRHLAAPNTLRVVSSSKDILL